MYFKSRTEAGIALAAKLTPKYLHQRNAVVALNDGGVIVATQIALRLRSVLMMMLTEAVELPREPEAIGGVTQDGQFTPNSAYSESEMDEFEEEYRTYLDEKKVESTHRLNALLGEGTLIKRSLLMHHNIILVSDGLGSNFSLDAAANFLKPVNYKKLIVATPLASVGAVDRMHIIADDIYCLDVIEDYLSTSHYYEVNDVPDHEVIIDTVETVLKQWPSARAPTV